MTSKLKLLPSGIAERLSALPNQAASVQGLDALWLFGSFARGDATPVSDVDLAYLAERSLTGPARDQLDLKLYAVVAATLQSDEFALVNLEDAPAYFAWSVFREGRLLWCRDHQAVASVAESVFRVAPDIRWFRHVGNEEFLRGVQMPKSSVDRDRILEFLRLITGDLRVLREKAGATTEAYLSSPDMQAVVERRLQTAAEGCLNIGNHLIARMELRAPQDYGDVFRSLGQTGILPADLVERMVEMAKFRNLLVHVYWGLDHERVHHSLPVRIDTLEAFVLHISQWLSQ